jgi:Ca2+-binding EF-hand superfamily protein
MLEKFDADGDGVLSDAEKLTAKEAKKALGAERREKMVLKHFDEDGDGVLSESEQAAADKAKAKRLAKFDADGDGELSREEHMKARKAMKGQRGGKKGTCKDPKGAPPEDA